METCIFIRNIQDVQIIQTIDGKKIDTVVYGDYGCLNHLLSVEKIIEFKNILSLDNIKLHYVSPKVTLYTIEKEEHRILKLLAENISVSINDLGLLYRLKTKIKSSYNIYLGRLLSKSIADWIWSDIFFEKENEDTIKYLSQNNFNHHIKIEYFKKWGIRGIEVNIHKRGEESYLSMQEQGLLVMGYVNKAISAVSRSCPYLKLNSKNGSNDCAYLCNKSLFIKPSLQEHIDVYPLFQLSGNVIYSTNKEDIHWPGYDKLVYTVF